MLLAMYTRMTTMFDKVWALAQCADPTQYFNDRLAAVVRDLSPSDFKQLYTELGQPGRIPGERLSDTMTRIMLFGTADRTPRPGRINKRGVLVKGDHT